MLPAAFVVLADYAGTVDLSNRTEVRGRYTQDAVPAVGLDVVDIPSARVGVRDRTTRYTLGYSAIGVLPDAQAGLDPQLLNSGDVGFTWEQRRVRLSVAEYATYGEQNAGVLLAPPTTPGAPVPTGPTPANAPGAQLLAAPATVRFGSSRSVLESRVQLSRRWVGTSSIEYQMQGGTDAASRAVLLFMKGPRAEASATFAASREDELETRASVLRGDTTSGPCSPVILGIAPGATCAPTVETAQATESWLRRLTRSSQAWLGGGASAMWLRLNSDERFVRRVYPVGIAAFQHQRVVEEIRTTVRVELRVAPVLDVRTGIADERAQGTVTLSLPVQSALLTGSFTGAHTVASSFVAPVSTLQGTFEVDYRIAPEVSCGGGIRYAWQEQGPFGSFAGGAAFAQVTFRAPQIRF